MENLCLLIKIVYKFVRVVCKFSEMMIPRFSFHFIFIEISSPCKYFISHCVDLSMGASAVFPYICFLTRDGFPCPLITAIPKFVPLEELSTFSKKRYCFYMSHKHQNVLKVCLLIDFIKPCTFFFHHQFIWRRC